MSAVSRKIEPQASGRFKVRFRYQGKQTSETFRTRKAAQDFASAAFGLFELRVEECHIHDRFPVN